MEGKRLITAIVAALTVMGAQVAPARAADVIVGWQGDPGVRAQLRAELGIEHVSHLPDLGAAGAVELVDVADGQAQRALEQLRSSPHVAWAEIDRQMVAAGAPNDPAWPSQWQAGMMGVPGAWDLSTGNGQTIAIVDSGIDLSNGDLTSRLTLSTEVLNGRDDDGDGYVDNTVGWDFVAGDRSPADENGHGTHVSSIAAARAFDGYALAGMAPGARILPLRALDKNKYGTYSNIGRAMSYAVSHGARIVNLSIAGTSPSTYLEGIIRSSPGVVFVAAAGNAGSDLDSTRNAYPCLIDAANVLCVAAGDANGTMPAWTNRGARSVDLVAGGQSVPGYIPGGAVQNWSGTSQAAPQVSAAAAMLLARVPQLTGEQAAAQIKRSARRLPGIAGRVSDGWVDAAAALAQAGSGRAPAAREAPYLSGRAAVGDRVILTSGIWDDPAAAVTSTWQVCGPAGCEMLGNALSWWAAEPRHVGATLTVTVTASNAFGAAQVTLSAGPVTGAPAGGGGGGVQLPGAVTLSGAAQVGAELQAAGGDGAYDWRRCPANADVGCLALGQLGAAYTLGLLDLGARVQVRSVQRSSSGVLVGSDWTSTAPVAAAATSPPAAPEQPPTTQQPDGGQQPPVLDPAPPPGSQLPAEDPDVEDEPGAGAEPQRDRPAARLTARVSGTVRVGRQLRVRVSAGEMLEVRWYRCRSRCALVRRGPASRTLTRADRFSRMKVAVDVATATGERTVTVRTAKVR